MKNLWLVLAALIALSIVFPTQAQQEITLEKATEIIRAFWGRPDFQITKAGRIEKVKGRIAQEFFTQDRIFYEGGQAFRGAGDSIKIDLVTGEVSYAFLYDNRSTKGSYDWSQPVNFTQEQAQKIAYEFAAEKYKGFKEMNMVLVEAKGLPTLGWEFFWEEQVAETGAYTLNYVCVDVDPWNGKVTAYSALRRPTKISTVPKISREEAIRIAQNATKIFNDPKKVELHVWWDDLGEQYLKWDVNFGGVWLWIDANNGQILQVLTVAGFGGGANPDIVNKPRIALNKREYLDIYHLVFKDGVAYIPVKAFEFLGAKLTQDKPTILITKGNQKVSIDIETGQVTSNTRKIQHRAYRSADRIMVPLRAICDALHLSVQWDPQREIINIITK